MLSKMEGKHEKSKHLADLRGLCPILVNASAHKCKLVQDFLETETVVLLHNPPYSPDLSPCYFFLFTLLKTISPYVDMSPKVLLAVPLLAYPKKSTYLHSESKF